MEPGPIRYPKAVLAGWAMLVLAGFVFTAGLDNLLFGYARYRQALDYRTHVAEAQRLAEANEYAQAFLSVRRAIELAPDRPEPYNVAGDLHYQLQHWESALDAYRRAIERGSTNPGVRVNSVWALIELQRHEEAAKLGKESMAQGYTVPELPRYVAEALMRAEAHEKAIPYFRQALEHYPYNQYLWGRLQQAYEAIGDNARAAGIAQRIRNIEGRLDANIGGALP